jgi:hypothetical protein
MGIPFNNLRNADSNLAQEKRIAAGHPGSSCPHGHLRFNTEFTEKPICLASRQYQKAKLEALAKLNDPDKERLVKDVLVKTCICFDLGASALIKNKINVPEKDLTPAICPGPNLAYFSKIMTFKEMVDHIYGRANVLNSKYRPHMFIKELEIYINNFTEQLGYCKCALTETQLAAFSEFKTNMLDGIAYYQKLFGEELSFLADEKERVIGELSSLKRKIESFTLSATNSIRESAA